MPDDGATSPDLPLTTEDVAAYAAIAAGESHGSIERLKALGLVVEGPYEPGLPLALDPQDAHQKLLEALSAELAGTVEQLRHLPELLKLRAVYVPERDSATSERLQTMTQMDTRIGEASSRATEEVLSAQPIPRHKRNQQSLRTGSDRSFALLARGVPVRLLYGPSAVADPASREYCERFIAAGGQVRIHRKSFVRTVIVDRAACFVDDCAGSGTSAAAGYHISDVAAVAWARRVYDHLWESSCTWRESIAWMDEAPPDRLLEILGHMDAGLEQPVIAKRVGISQRQLTTDLKEAREVLGLRSTYQLMSWYGRWMARR
ncbi:hypothetical protein [Streptomyces sp. NPDC001389]|uniref:hypothetical protein n=1 Tax=Streptomyces sp. NPDC001389 TaxID=3364569 RepID=UPI003682011C